MLATWNPGEMNLGKVSEASNSEKRIRNWQMVKIVWIDSAIEDLNAIGES